MPIYVQAYLLLTGSSMMSPRAYTVSRYTALLKFRAVEENMLETLPGISCEWAKCLLRENVDNFDDPDGIHLQTKLHIGLE